MDFFSFSIDAFHDQSMKFWPLVYELCESKVCRISKLASKEGTSAINFLIQVRLKHLLRATYGPLFPLSIMTRLFLARLFLSPIQASSFLTLSRL